MQSYNSCLCPFCVHLIQTVTQTSAHKTSSVHVKVSPLSLHPDLAISYRICIVPVKFKFQDPQILNLENRHCTILKNQFQFFKAIKLLKSSKK